MSENRAFRGVWIPADLWQNRTISIQEKVMLVEIDSLSSDPVRGCFKRNQGFAEFFGLSKNRVSEVIKSLEKKGFIRIEYKKQGKQIIERRIFMIAPFGKPATPSENCDTPFGKQGHPPSENCEESNTLLSNTTEGIIGTPTGMPCKSCGGIGSLSTFYDDIGASVCHDCQGSGVIEEQSCYICDGEQPGCATCKPGYNRDSDEATGKQLSVYPDKPVTTKKTETGSKASQYPDEFEWIWKNKPQRIGSNPKKKAYNACRARLKEGATWRELAEGMQRYTAHCKTEQKLNSQYVMQLATFFGPDEHFKEAWKAQQKAQEGAQAENPVADPESYTKAPEITQEQLESTSRQLSNLKGLL